MVDNLIVNNETILLIAKMIADMKSMIITTLTTIRMLFFIALSKEHK